MKKLDHLVQLLIPPTLILLLLLTIYDLFFGLGRYVFLVDIFDIFTISIFSIDLYYRWHEKKNAKEFFRYHWLDILATIPFNWIFIGLDKAIFVRSVRGFRIITRYSRLLRLFRVAARAPRFLKLRELLKPTIIHKKQPHEKEMKNILSFPVVLLVTINSIMGTGIWFLTAAGAEKAGPASLLSWVLLSFISIYIAMCFSELTSMFPKAGGVYEFAKQTYGRFMSFVVGWTTSISGSVTIAMLMLGALQYIIPHEFSYFSVPIALLLTIVFSFIAYCGMKSSTYMLVGFAIITLATIVGIIVPGLFSINPANYQPFFVFPTFSVLLAIFFIAETFFGWESAIFLSAETKNPRKTMPKALIIGTIIIALFSILLTFTALGVIPWQEYAQSAAPLRDLGQVYFGDLGGLIFTLLVAISILGAVATWIVTAPRLLMALAEDKLFFVHFSKIHPKFKSPYVSIIFQCVVLSILIIIGAGSYEMLLHLLVPLILVLYSLVLFSVTLLRFRHPEYERPFEAPFGKVGPVITIFFMMFLLVMFVYETHHALNYIKISAALLSFGIPAYFFIELFYDPEYINLRRSIMSHLQFGHHRRFMHKMYHVLQPINKSTTIIDYDYGKGSFFKYLIKRKTSFKKLYAIDDKKEISHVKTQIPKDYQEKIQTVVRRFPSFPSLPVSDIFIAKSFGYTPNPGKFVRHIAQTLTKNGRYCLLVRHNIANMSPNALLLEDEKKLKKMFHELGLTCSIEKRVLFFYEEILIFGHKHHEVRFVKNLLKEK